MDQFKKWQEQDAGGRNRIVALLIGALIFPISIPILLIIVMPQVDKLTGFPSYFCGAGNIVVGALAILIGGGFALWTIAIQIMLASGTPFPMMPTKKLLVIGPFKYCRNPMTLGTIIAYAGIATLIGSVSALVVVVLFAAALITYLKLVEERELEMRFGDEYLEYKRTTPFILPRIKG